MSNDSATPGRAVVGVTSAGLFSSTYRLSQSPPTTASAPSKIGICRPNDAHHVSSGSSERLIEDEVTLRDRGPGLKHGKLLSAGSRCRDGDQFRQRRRET